MDMNVDVDIYGDVAAIMYMYVDVDVSVNIGG